VVHHVRIVALMNRPAVESVVFRVYIKSGCGVGRAVAETDGGLTLVDLCGGPPTGREDAVQGFIGAVRDRQHAAEMPVFLFGGACRCRAICWPYRSLPGSDLVGAATSVGGRCNADRAARTASGWISHARHPPRIGWDGR